MPYKLRDTTSSVKLLFTGYLLLIALAYCMSVAQILMTHGMADGKFYLSVDNIIFRFYGNRSGSLLENKLNGSMKNRLPNRERIEIVQWIHSGAQESAFIPHIRKIFDQYCISCHNARISNIIPDFTRFDNIKARTVSDNGLSYNSLTRISHIHLFGIAFIFFSVGFIFTNTTILPITLKNTVIVMPYVFLTADVASWWLTKIDPRFAWVIIISGAGLFVVFVIMWVVALYEMWFISTSAK